MAPVDGGDLGAAAAWTALLSVVGDATEGAEPPVKLHQALCSIAAAAGVQSAPAMTLPEVRLCWPHGLHTAARKTHSTLPIHNRGSTGSIPFCWGAPTKLVAASSTRAQVLFPD